MPHRGICPRCGHHEAWAPRFSAHLGECDLPFSIDVVFSMLDVTVGTDDACWEIPNMHSVPKIGTAPKQVMYAYVVVAIASYGDSREHGLMVCHICDNRKCLNPGHLYWGTSADNSRDAWRNGRRSMSFEQKEAMKKGRAASEKNAARMLAHNRELAKHNSGDSHWTHRSDEEMERWKAAIRASKAR